MSTMKNSDNKVQKLKNEIAKLKTENKQLSKRLKANNSGWKMKLAEAINAAENAIQAAYNQGHKDSTALHEQKAKEKSKILAEAEAIFNKKFNKKMTSSSKMQSKEKPVSAKRKLKKRKMKLEKAAKSPKAAKMAPSAKMSKKRKMRKMKKNPVSTVMEEKPTSPVSPIEPTIISEPQIQPYKSEFEF